MKVVWETLKIFSLDPADVRVSCTAVRVPILRAHSLSITIETIQPITATAARYTLFIIKLQELLICEVCIHHSFNFSVFCEMLVIVSLFWLL